MAQKSLVDIAETVLATFISSLVTLVLLLYEKLCVLSEKVSKKAKAITES